MVFKTWQIGLEIQQKAVFAVAVLRQKQGWQLRRWWQIPLPEKTFESGILLLPKNVVTALMSWRRELPLNHQLRVAFPTQRTLQRQIVSPDSALSESALDGYFVAATARELQMPPTQLCCDRSEALQPDGQHQVIAVRQTEITTLQQCLSMLRLSPATITPGACALSLLATACKLTTVHYVIHKEDDHWLWATSEQPPRWGWVDIRQAGTFKQLCQLIDTKPENTAFSCATGGCIPPGTRFLDAWQIFSRLQPPLPKNSGPFAIAIALAIGRLSQ